MLLFVFEMKKIYIQKVFQEELKNLKSTKSPL